MQKFSTRWPSTTIHASAGESMVRMVMSRLLSPSASMSARMKASLSGHGYLRVRVDKEKSRHGNKFLLPFPPHRAASRSWSAPPRTDRHALCGFILRALLPEGRLRQAGRGRADKPPNAAPCSLISVWRSLSACTAISSTAGRRSGMGLPGALRPETR